MTIKHSITNEFLFIHLKFLTTYGNKTRTKRRGDAPDR